MQQSPIVSPIPETKSPTLRNHMQRILVSVQNQIGDIAKVTQLLAEAGINIVSLNSEDQGESGLIIITTAKEDHHRSLQIFADAGYRAISDEYLVVKILDEPGALAKIAGKFQKNGLNILSIHIVNRQSGYTTVSISSDDNAKARVLIAGDQEMSDVAG